MAIRCLLCDLFSIAMVLEDTNATNEIELVQQRKQQLLSFCCPLCVLARALLGLGIYSASPLVS